MKLKLMQKLTMTAIATFSWAPVYGTVTGPGTISSLSANALDRSGYWKSSVVTSVAAATY